MTLLEKVSLICAVSVILFPIVVVNIFFIMDAIYSYFEDKWVRGLI